MKKVSVMLMVGLVMIWVSGASAAMLTVDNTVVVDDNFENASQVSHTPWTSGDTTDADPDNAIVGSWTVTENLPNVIQVTDYGTTGAYEGDNYLRIRRTTGGSGGDYSTAKLVGTRQTSGTAHLKIMTYVDVTNASTASVKLYDGSTVILGLYFNDGKIKYYDGWGYKDTGLSYIVDAWKELDVDWVIGGHDFDVTYDGNSGTGVVWHQTSGIDSVLFAASDYGHDVFYDAVPEPATIGLLAVGMLGLLRRKK